MVLGGASGGDAHGCDTASNPGFETELGDLAPQDPPPQEDPSGAPWGPVPKPVVRFVYPEGGGDLALDAVDTTAGAGGSAAVELLDAAGTLPASQVATDDGLGAVAPALSSAILAALETNVAAADAETPVRFGPVDVPDGAVSKAPQDATKVAAVVIADAGSDRVSSTDGDATSGQNKGMGAKPDASLSIQAQIWMSSNARPDATGALPQTVSATAQPTAAVAAQVTVIRAAQPSGHTAVLSKADQAIAAALVSALAEPETASPDVAGVKDAVTERTSTVPVPAASHAAQAFADRTKNQALVLEAVATAAQMRENTAATVQLNGPSGAIVTASTSAVVGAAALPTQVIAALIAASPPANVTADRVEVILSPEELGKVQMDFRGDGDAMRVFLTAERPETLDLLRRHGDLLVTELRQAGFSGASLSFGHWGQSQRGTGDQLPQTNTALAAGRDAVPPIPTYKPTGVSGQGLDLRI